MEERFETFKLSFESCGSDLVWGKQAFTIENTITIDDENSLKRYGCVFAQMLDHISYRGNFEFPVIFHSLVEELDNLELAKDEEIRIYSLVREAIHKCDKVFGELSEQSQIGYEDLLRPLLTLIENWEPLADPKTELERK